MSLKIIPIHNQQNIIKAKDGYFQADSGTTNIIQSNEMKEVILTMNDLTINPETKTSKIDPFSNLEDHHVSNITRWDNICAMGVAGFSSIDITRQLKVLRISIKREGRKEIVEMHKANLDNQANKGFNIKKMFGVQ